MESQSYGTLSSTVMWGHTVLPAALTQGASSEFGEQTRQHNLARTVGYFDNNFYNVYYNSKYYVRHTGQSNIVDIRHMLLLSVM